MSKVWNVVGSFIGDYEMIPEGSTLESVNYIQSESKLNYYSGEYYNPSLMKFQATFRLPDKTTLKTINIPSNQMETNPKGDLGDIMGIDTPFQYVDSGTSGSDSQRSTANITFWYQYKENQSAQVQEASVTVTFFIWKEKFTFDRIEIIKYPDKMEYYNGDYFNPEGMEIAVYSKEGLVRYPKQCENKNTQVDCFYFNLPIVLRPTESGYTTVPVIYKAIPDFESSTTTIEFSIQVRVYEDERKAQLDVSLAGAKTLYYSGSTFSKSGIIVKKKYPQDVTYPDTNIANQCVIQILEFPSGVVEYNEINQGNLTLIVSYTDEENSNKVTTVEIRDQIKVYRANGASFNQQGAIPQHQVGETLSKTSYPMTITYVPSNIVSHPSFNQSYLNVTNYNWVAENNVINSAGVLLSERSPAYIKAQWTHPDDPKQQKTVLEASLQINIVKQIIRIDPPSTKYNQANPYPVQENSSFYVLKGIDGITTSSSSTSLKTGISSVTVKGQEYNNTSYPFTISQSEYYYQCTINLDTANSNYTYVWSDTNNNSPKSVTVYGQVQANHTAQVSFSPSDFEISYDYSNNNKTSATVTVLISDRSTGETVTPEGNALEVTRYDDNYISLSMTAGIKNNSRIQITAKDGDTYESEVNAYIYLGGSTVTKNETWRKTTITIPSSSFSGTVKYLNRWNWNQEVSPEWIQGLKSNNPSRYVGQTKDVANLSEAYPKGVTVFLVDVSGSTLTWACYNQTNTQFLTGSQDLFDWSSGGCNIQSHARSFATRAKRIFGTLKSESRQIRWDYYNGRGGYSRTYNMEAWPPSAEEWGLITSDNYNQVMENTTNDDPFGSGEPNINSTFWLCNGGLANEGGTPPSGSNINKVVGVRQVVDGVAIANKKAGNEYAIEVFCFKC